MLELATPVQYVKGIGPRLSEALAPKGIHTVEDLLHYLPFRYEDRLNPRRIGELQAGEMASIIAEVRGAKLYRTRSLPIFEIVVADPGVGAAAFATHVSQNHRPVSYPPDAHF